MNPVSVESVMEQTEETVITQRNEETETLHGRLWTPLLWVSVQDLCLRPLCFLRHGSLPLIC